MNLPAYPAAALAVAKALLAAAVDPADQVRLMLALAQSAPATSFGAVLRRMALIQTCRASAAYQPTSYDDAQALRALVCGALDAEIDAAGDAGEDEVYAAFRVLRIDVVLDLQARGDPLPRLRAVTVPPLPAAVLAHRLYGDATRAGDLVDRADPANPLIMPTSMVVLDQ